jgi:hypothetical protein
MVERLQFSLPQEAASINQVNNKGGALSLGGWSFGWAIHVA